jgi:hypothetical protein
MSRTNPATTHGNAGIAAWRFKMTAEIHSFEDCRDAFFGAPDGAEWRTGFGIRDLVIGPNMYLRPIVWQPQTGIPDAYAIVLYETEIVRYYRDGSFSVDNGGRATLTTMYRLCAVLPPPFSAYHHRKQLGLRADSLRVTFSPISHAARRDGERVLWPLDHSKRIDCETGEI